MSSRTERPASTAAALLCRPLLVPVPDEVDGRDQTLAVDDDPDEVAVDEPTDRPSLERLRADVTDARSGRDARESCVGDERDLPPKGRNLSADVSW